MKRTFVLALALVACTAGSARAAISTSEIARLLSAASAIHDMGGTVAQPSCGRGRCVAVIPDLKKPAFIFGGEYGKGMMSWRAGDGWSAPVFIQLAKGSWGFQAGAEQVDVVLLVMNESGVQKLLQNQVNLGADASVAAGPIGRHGAVGTDAALTAEVLSYSRAKGLFAGIDLSGGVLKPDDDANRDVYGDRATPRTLLASSDLSAPIEATPLLSALRAGAPASNGPAPTTSAAPGQTKTAITPGQPSTAAPATNNADLRARIVEIEQSIDRLIAEADRS